ncbi:hypothetical protein GGS21DRAFT_155011 [Xylaria nigripes]|nr:hypothetical protein GGS21DRAFT_155011 [Xylaria nigripes]
MSILCCCHHLQPAEKDTPTEAIELPTQPPRATLSKTLSRSETDMYLSSILASRAPSQLITPTYQSIVDPEAVDVEDSDDDAQVKQTRQTSMSSLGALRTKLIRRLSHRADAKAGTQPSVGASDEELARRAELKRLMHKRIQEELKSEQEEDDLRLQSSIGNGKESELPGGGPRDAIEFSVCGFDEKQIKYDIASPEPSALLTSAINEQQGPWQKPRSRPQSVKKSIDGTRHECISLDERGSDTRPLSPSHLTPVDCFGEDGCESPSTASWRLSYSAVQIDSYIEPLVEISPTPRRQSPELKDPLSQHETDTTHPHEAGTIDPTSSTQQEETIDPNQTIDSEQEDVQEHREVKENSNLCNLSDETSDGRYSPLDVWLCSQGLHRTLDLSSGSNSDIVSETPRISDTREQAEDSRQYDTLTNLTADVSIPQENNVGVWHQLSETSANGGIPSTIVPSTESFASHQFLDRIENVAPPKELSTKGQTHNVSSQNRPRPVSQQAISGVSRLSLAELLGSRRALRSVTPIHGPINLFHTTTSDNSGTSSYRTALNQTPSSEHPKSKIEASQLPVADLLSINASETASYRQREEELKSVEQRFVLTPARRYPLTPVRSKFREEFEDLKSLGGAKGSILSKLYLAFPKKTRVSSSQTESSKSNEAIGKQSADCLNWEKPNSYSLESHDDILTCNVMPEIHTEEKETTGLWGRPIKPGGGQYTGRLKAKLMKVSNPKIDMNVTETQSPAVKNRCTDNPEAHGVSEDKDTPVMRTRSPPRTPNNVAVLSEAEINDATDIHAGVLQEWVEKFQAEDLRQQSRAGSGSDGTPRPPSKLRTTPESWARWPLHTHEERTGSARECDRVATRDFAMTLNSNPFALGAGRDKKTSKESELTPSSRTLPSRFGEALKLGWNKMVVHRDSPDRALGHAPASQHTRMSREFWEDPELEPLPTAECCKEVQSPEQQIDSIKRCSKSRPEVTSQPSNDSTTNLLANHIAEEVHNIESEEHNITWPGIKYRARSPLNRQLPTPTHALNIPSSKLSNAEPAGTTEPQCTYEECVQTQMLDDDDEDKGDKCQETGIIKRARSTGNIDVKLSGGELPFDEDIRIGQVLVHETWKSGLRRHRSLGFLARGRAHDSVRDIPTTAGQGKPTNLEGHNES